MYKNGPACVELAGFPPTAVDQRSSDKPICTVYIGPRSDPACVSWLVPPQVAKTKGREFPVIEVRIMDERPVHAQYNECSVGLVWQFPSKKAW